MARRHPIDQHVVHERAVRRQQGGILDLAHIQCTGIIAGDALDGGQRILPGNLDLTHMADIEHAGAGADGEMLGGDA